MSGLGGAADLKTSCLMVMLAESHFSKLVMYWIATGMMALITDTTVGTSDAPMMAATLVRALLRRCNKAVTMALSVADVAVSTWGHNACWPTMCVVSSVKEDEEKQERPGEYKS